MWKEFRDEPDRLVFAVCMLGWAALAIAQAMDVTI